MIKKIQVSQIKNGMYIHDFNCGWLNHPFLTNSMLVDSDEIIKKVVDYGIRELYIDTNKGYDVADAPTEVEVKQQIEAEITKVVEQEKRHVYAPVPIHEEIAKAKEIRQEAKKTVQNIMDDIKFGKQIETEKVGRVVDDMIESIFRNQDALISLGRIKEKDEYTYMHSVSVCVLMLSFGKHLGFDLQILREIGAGAMLHDIGKMIVPQAVLNKEEGLTEEELKLMKKHVEYSRTLLEQTQGMTENAIVIASQHHERVDGTGYPLGLKGDDISYYSKAVAIVDVYDAMTSKRCYQDQYLPTEVLRKLYEWSSHHYDRDLVQQFIRCVGIYPVGTLVRMESGRIGVIIKHGEKNLLQPVVRVVYNMKSGDFLRIPYDVDLSSTSGKNGEDRIAGYESPKRFNIRPEVYL
ncbi:MAG: HD-GYP domain-containing protein [Nitrospiraceae bacterium]|nr:MAG: HD-GYP domain-containing protein [Nitrospiraceae bacterium]